MTFPELFNPNRTGSPLDLMAKRPQSSSKINTVDFQDSKSPKHRSLSGDLNGLDFNSSQRPNPYSEAHCDLALDKGGVVTFSQWGRKNEAALAGQDVFLLQYDNWQSDTTQNTAKMTAAKTQLVQFSHTNKADVTQSKQNAVIQSGYGSNTNLVEGTADKEGTDFVSQFSMKKNEYKGGNGTATVIQYGNSHRGDDVQHIADGSNNAKLTLTQHGDAVTMNAKGSQGNDQLTHIANNSTILSDPGKGDDSVLIRGVGNKGTVTLADRDGKDTLTLSANQNGLTVVADQNDTIHFAENRDQLNITYDDVRGGWVVKPIVKDNGKKTGDQQQLASEGVFIKDTGINKLPRLVFGTQGYQLTTGNADPEIMVTDDRNKVPDVQHVSYGYSSNPKEKTVTYPTIR